MWIVNLRGIFTCEGFRRKQGRFPTEDDLGWINGPAHIEVDDETGRLIQITRGDRRQSLSPGDVDGTDLIASPGFVDCHTHAIFDGSRADEYFERWAGTNYLEIARRGGGIRRTVRATAEASDEMLIQSLEQRLKKMLSSGVTCVEIKTGYGGTPEQELRLLRLIRSLTERADLPRIVTTFLALHSRPENVTAEEYVAQMEAVLPAVKQERLAEFVDLFVESEFFDLDTSLGFARHAQQLELGIKAHVDQLTPLCATEKFCDLGAVSVDHLEHISDEGIDQLAKSATVAVLIPASGFFLNQSPAPARRLVDNGARVALATDFNPGTAPSLSLGFTMLLAACQLHLTAAEIVCGVTFNGALGLGLASSHGTLERGIIADILLWPSRSLNNHQPSLFWEKVIVEQLLPTHVFQPKRSVPLRRRPV